MNRTFIRHATERPIFHDPDGTMEWSDVVFRLDKIHAVVLGEQHVMVPHAQGKTWWCVSVHTTPVSVDFWVEGADSDDAYNEAAEIMRSIKTAMED